jgi:exodeoxyribonuclease VII large subunit
VRALTERLRAAHIDVRHLAARVQPARLVSRIAQGRVDAARIAQRLARAAGMAGLRQRVGAATVRLTALSPRAVLARGYSLVTLEDGTVVRQARQLAPGRAVELEFANGRAAARVESVREGAPTEE